jgi:hypothetical protein
VNPDAVSTFFAGIVETVAVFADPAALPCGIRHCFDLFAKISKWQWQDRFQRGEFEILKSDVLGPVLVL